MKIYIDTNTFPATPGIYADAAKTKPLPRVIPLVQGFRGTVQIAFVGELAPRAGDGVTLAMRPFGAQRDILVTPPVAASTDTGEDGVSAVAEINLAVDTSALADALGSREAMNVLCGVVVTDDAAAFPTRVEWQIVFSVSASALANGVPPDISPSAAERLREEIETVKTDLAENYVTLNTAQVITEQKTFRTGTANENTGGGILVGRFANDGSEGIWRLDGSGLRLEAIRSGGGFLTEVGTDGVSADRISGRYLCGTFIRSVSPLADGGLGGLISVPHVPGDTPIGQETLALKSDIAAAVSSVYRYRGTVVTEADLPASGNAIGDVWNVNDTGKNFAWDGTAWDALGGDVQYTTMADVEEFTLPYVESLRQQILVNAQRIEQKADVEEAKSKITAITVQSGTSTDVASLYGWRGDLRRLGAWGGAVAVEAITIKRGDGSDNANVALWARLVKQIDSGWQVVAEAKGSRAWDEVGVGEELTWEMQAVPGVVPPSADDHVAIVFVNDPGKQANASDGALRFRVVENVRGGITGTLVQSNPTAQSYSPWFKLRFAPLAGVDKAATEAELQTLQSSVAIKANDADVVHLSGNETITGVKTFSLIRLPRGSKISLSNANVDVVDVDENLTVTVRAINAIFGGVAGTGSLSVLPLGTKTALGADACGLHVSATGGLQLFGTHFLRGDIWTDSSLKIVANNVSLYSTDEAAIGFDYANKVVFRTMPNDGTEATYSLEAWQWDDDSHSSKSPSAGVKLLKPSQKTALEANSVLNMQEGDKRWRCLRGTGGASVYTLSYDETYLGSTLILEYGHDTLLLGLPYKEGRLALDGDVVHLAGTETISGVKSFTGGIRASSISSTAGTRIYDTTDSKGFNFKGIYTLGGYVSGGASATSVTFFKQENATTNWIDVTTLKEGGVAIAEKYASKTQVDANTAALGGLKFVAVTQAEYDALEAKDAATIYFVTEGDAA